MPFRDFARGVDEISTSDTVTERLEPRILRALVGTSVCESEDPLWNIEQLIWSYIIIMVMKRGHMIA